jgi:cation transport ATPase
MVAAIAMSSSSAVVTLNALRLSGRNTPARRTLT